MIISNYEYYYCDGCAEKWENTFCSNPMLADASMWLKSDRPDAVCGDLIEGDVRKTRKDCGKKATRKLSSLTPKHFYPVEPPLR